MFRWSHSSFKLMQTFEIQHVALGCKMPSLFSSVIRTSNISVTIECLLYFAYSTCMLVINMWLIFPCSFRICEDDDIQVNNLNQCTFYHGNLFPQQSMLSTVSLALSVLRMLAHFKYFVLIII